MTKKNGKRLKILHIIVGTEFGGATVMVRLLSQYQIESGHDVSVLPNDVPGAIEEFRNHGIKVINDKGIKGHMAPFSDLFHLFYWIRLLRKHSFDVVHTQTVKAGLIGRVAAKIAGVETIIHSGQGYRLEKKFKCIFVEIFYVVLERLLSKLSTVVIVPSVADYNTALKLRIVSKKKLKLVYNGIDISDYESPHYHIYRRKFRDEIGVEDDKIVIGTVARLNKAKGHSCLIDATAFLLKDNELNVKFVFAGDGPEKDNLKKAVKLNSLEKYFLFLNHRNDVEKVMMGIDVHVLPSLREGFGIVFLEAMAAGNPCVATDVGGPAEAVKDGVTGFVVPPDDHIGLANAINKLIKDKQLISKMGRNGLARVNRKFTIDIMGEKISDIYNNSMENSNNDC